MAVNGGYGFGVGGQDYLADEFASGSMTYTEDTYGDWHVTEFEQNPVTFGSGGKIGLTGTLMPTENWGILADIDVSFGGGSSFTYTDRENTGITNTEEAGLKASYMTLALGLKFKGTSKVAPYAYVGPGILIPFSIAGEIEYSYPGVSEPNDEIEVDASAAFGFISGLGVSIAFSDLIGMQIECSPRYLFGKVSEVRFIDHDNADADETYTIIYEGDQASIPDDIDNGNNYTEYLRGSPSISYGSIAARLGLTFTF